MVLGFNIYCYFLIHLLLRQLINFSGFMAIGASLDALTGLLKTLRIPEN